MEERVGVGQLAQLRAQGSGTTAGTTSGHSLVHVALPAEAEGRELEVRHEGAGGGPRAAGRAFTACATPAGQAEGAHLTSMRASRTRTATAHRHYTAEHRSVKAQPRCVRGGRRLKQLNTDSVHAAPEAEAARSPTMQRLSRERWPSSLLKGSWTKAAPLMPCEMEEP